MELDVMPTNPSDEKTKEQHEKTSISDVAAEVLHSVADSVTISHFANVHLPKNVGRLGIVAEVVSEILHDHSNNLPERLVCGTGVAIAKEAINASLAGAAGMAAGSAATFAESPAAGVATGVAAAILTHKMVSKASEPIAKNVQNACHAGFEWMRSKASEYKQKQTAQAQTNLYTTRMRDHGLNPFAAPSCFSTPHFSTFTAQPFSYFSPHFSNFNNYSSYNATPFHKTWQLPSYIQSVIKNAVQQEASKISPNLFNAYMKAQSDLGFGYSLSYSEFSTVVKTTSLTMSYNNCNPAANVRDVMNFMREIGGVGHDVGIIEDLIDSEAQQSEAFFLCFLTKNLPLSVELCEQMAREIANAYHNHKTLPFMSLHPNEFGYMYLVLHPAFQDTLVGVIISLLDYWMKGYLNGGIYDENFLKTWQTLKDCNETQLREKLIDLKKYVKTQCPGINYVSLRERMSQANISEKRSSASSAYKQPYMTSFRIFALLKSIKRQGNVLIPENGIRIEHSIEMMPDYKEHIEKYFRENGCYPDDYQAIEGCYHQYAEEMKEKLPQMKFCETYFQLLGVMNSLCYSVVTFEKMGKKVVFDVQPTNTIYEVPKAFPPIPVRYFQTYPISISVAEFLKSSVISTSIMNLDESLFSLFSQNKSRTLPLVFTDKIPSAAQEIIKQKLAPLLPGNTLLEVNEDEVARLQKTISFYFQQQVALTKKTIHKIISDLAFNVIDKVPSTMPVVARLQATKLALQSHVEDLKTQWQANPELAATQIFKQVPKSTQQDIQEAFKKIEDNINKELEEVTKQIQTESAAHIQKELEALKLLQTSKLSTEMDNIHKQEKEAREQLTQNEQSLLATMNTEIAKATANITQLTSVKTNLENQCAQGRQAITQLQQNQTNEINKIPVNLRALNQANINSFVASINQKTQVINQAIADMTKDINEISQEIARLNLAISKLRQDVEQDLAAIKKELTELPARVDTIKQEVSKKILSMQVFEEFKKEQDASTKERINTLEAKAKEVLGLTLKDEAIRIITLICEQDCTRLEKCFSHLKQFLQSLFDAPKADKSLLSKKYTHTFMTFTGSAAEQQMGDSFKISGGCAVLLPNVVSQTLENGDAFCEQVAKTMFEEKEKSNTFQINGEQYTVLNLAVKDLDNALEMVQQVDEEPAITVLQQLMMQEKLSLDARLLNKPLDKSGATLTHYAAALLSGDAFEPLLIPDNLLHQDKLGHLPIHAAAQIGNAEVVGKILAQNSSQKEAQDKREATPLLIAAEHGKADVVQTLLTHGAIANHRLPNGVFALYVAIQNNFPDVALLLLSHNNDVGIHEKLDNGMTALHLAIETKQTVVALALIEKGAPLDARRKEDGFTPYHCAAKTGQLHLLAPMLARGIPINLPLESKKTALHLAAAAGQLAVVKFLIEKGAGIDDCSVDGDTPLMLAIKAGQTDTALELAKLATINTVNQHGQTASLLALQQGMPKVADVLIKRNENPEIKDRNGHNYLYYLVRNGEYQRFTALLISSKLEVNQCFDGESLLAIAGRFGHFLIVNTLLKQKAKFISQTPAMTLAHYAVIADEVGFVRDYLEKNPLPNNPSLTYLAAKHSSQRCLDFLLKKFGINTEEQSLLQASIESNNPITVDKLLLRLEDVNKPLDSNGNTALHLAASNGSFQVLKLLLTRGSNLNARNLANQTAFHIALSQDDNYLLKKLFKLTKPSDWPMDLWQSNSVKSNSEIAKTLKKYAKRLPNTGVNLPVNIPQKSLDSFEGNKQDLGELEEYINNGEFSEAIDLLKTKPALVTIFKTKQGGVLFQKIFANIHDYSFIISKLKTEEGVEESDYEDLLNPTKSLLTILKEADIDPSQFLGDENVLLSVIMADSDQEACYRFDFLADYFPKSLNTLCSDNYSTKVTFARLALRHLHSNLFKKIDAICNQTHTPFYGLHEAVLANNYQLTKELLRSYSANTFNRKKQTPLMLAAANNNTRIMHLLLQCGASADLTDIEGKNALHYALDAKAEESSLLVLTLLRNKNQANRYGITPLQVAAAKGMLSVVQYLNRYKTRTLEVDTQGRNALHIAAMYGQVETALYLVNNGFAINAPETPTNPKKAKRSLGRTALHLAAHFGHTEVFIQLYEAALKQGHNPEQEDNLGQTVREYAVMSKNNAMLQLIQHLPSYHDTANNQRLLRAAVMVDNVDIVNELILREANLTAINEQGQSILHIACIYNAVQATAILVQGRDISLDLKEKAGNTALHIAALKGLARIIQTLLKAGANANALATDNNTALHLACREGHSGAVRILLNHKADLSSQNSQGLTPGQLALVNGHVQVARLCKDTGDNSLLAESIALLPLALQEKINNSSPDFIKEAPNSGRIIANALIKNGIYRNRETATLPSACMTTVLC